jgi:putative ABC transport system permease protein
MSASQATLHSIQQYLRALTRNPGLTATAVIMLALGIGASTAIFSVFWAVAIHPLPYQHAEQLVMLWRTEPAIPQLPPSGPDFLDWAQQSDVFSALAAAKLYHTTFKSAGATEHLNGMRVTPEFFKVMQVQPEIGRLFGAGDDQPGRDHVVVLGKGFGPQGPGRSPAAIGSTLTLDNDRYEVVGKLPDSFRFPPLLPMLEAQYDIYVPIPAEELNKNRQEPSVLLIGRLKPGITLRQAQTEMATIASRLSNQYPDSNAGVGIRVASLQEQVRSFSGIMIGFLLGAVGFLLLIACANIAVILLTRGVRRQREIAIRQALGATPARVTLQLLAESTLLALAAGAVGVLLTFWFKDALLALLPAFIPQTNPITVNWAVLAFALAVSVVTGGLFGIVPALRLSRVSLEGLLKDAPQEGGIGAMSTGTRDVLVVAEVTLALAMLIVCGLLIRGLAGFLVAKRGFNPRNLLTISITVADSKYPTFAARNGFGRGLLEQVSSLPGVRSSALEGESLGHSATADKPLTPSGFRQRPFTTVASVSADYFRTMQIPLLRGRQFSLADYLEKPSVSIVNSTLARQLWPNQDALGKRFTATYPPEWYEVVGIAADEQMMPGLDLPQAYVPKLSTKVDLLVRTAGDPNSTINPIRDLISKVDVNARVSTVMTMEESLARAAGPIRSLASVLGVMAAVALFLATVGVYVVTAYSVAQRTHEIGIRMALGAPRGQVLIAVMRHGLRLSVLGVALGLLIALALGRLLAFLLRGFTVGQISTYVGVSSLLLVVTLLANFIPARRATKVDPMTALRYD